MHKRSECVLRIEEWGATDVLRPSLTLPQCLALRYCTYSEEGTKLAYTRLHSLLDYSVLSAYI